MVGQPIGQEQGLFSASVHSSVSGKVLSVDNYHHPLGRSVLAVTIANDGEEHYLSLIQGSDDPFSLSADERQAH